MSLNSLLCPVVFHGREQVETVLCKEISRTPIGWIFKVNFLGNKASYEKLLFCVFDLLFHVEIQPRNTLARKFLQTSEYLRQTLNLKKVKRKESKLNAKKEEKEDKVVALKRINRGEEKTKKTHSEPI